MQQAPIDVAEIVDPGQPQTRLAECSCGRKVASHPSLPFFEDRSAGSDKALETCRNCFYHQVAHTPEVMARNSSLKCQNFEPIGAFRFDKYYCGCWGWD